MSAALSTALRAGRDRFNALFAAARHQHPDLDGEAFKDLLGALLEPLVAAVEPIAPDRVASVVDAAYEIALDLAAQHLAGSGARHPYIATGWQRVVTRCPKLLAERPFELLAATGNALHQLATTPGARPESWVATLADLAPRIADLDTFRRLGQLAAWRAGLAHYRLGALGASDSVDPALARAVLTIEGNVDWPTLRARLLDDPWFDPSASRNSSVRWVGGFRGFGGLFAEPPRITRSSEHLLVQSAGAAWLLVADAFGATFHRATDDEASSAGAPGVERNWAVKNSAVTFDGKSLPIEPRGELTSAVVDRTTIALTWSHSHHVALLSAKELV